MRILAISGSLRASSSNTQLLKAASMIAPEGVEVSVFEGIADIPAFNPDIDNDSPPESVSNFRNALRAADGVIISTPEYAHGVPGALKNALDWVVSSWEFGSKPVLLINGSRSAVFAQDSLMETLKVMDARVIGCVVVPLRGSKLDSLEMASDPDFSASLLSAIEALSAAIHDC